MPFSNVNAIGKTIGLWLVVGLLWFVAVCGLTWPLPQHATQFSDTWISELWNGSEVLGTIRTMEYIELCFDGQMGNAEGVGGKLATLVMGPARCAFETTAWNNLEVFTLVIPLKALLGPGGHWNGLWLVVIWLNVWAGWSLGRHFGRSLLAGLAGAAVFGFSPMVLVNAYQGRPLQAMLFAFPPVLIGVDKVLRGEGSWPRVVVTGLALALLVQLYWFNAHFLVLLGMPLLAGLTRPGPKRPRFLQLGALIGIGVALCVPAVLVYLDFSGAGRLPTPPELPSGSLLPFPQPGSSLLSNEQRVLLNDAAPIDALLQPIEYWRDVQRWNMAWLPTSVLLMVLPALVRWRRALPWLGVGLVSWSLTLGPWLKTSVGGWVETSSGLLYNPIYMALYAWVPLMDGLRHPNRFVVPLLVSIAMLAALAARPLRRSEGPWVVGRWGPVLVCVGLLAAAGTALVRAGLLPLNFTRFPIPPELIALRSEPGLDMLHVPLAPTMETGIEFAGRYQNWDNRLIGMRFVHGATMDYSLPFSISGGLPYEPRERDRTQSAIAARDPVALAALGPLVAEHLSDAGIDVVLLDEAGFVMRNGGRAGPGIYEAMRQSMVDTLGPPQWDLEVNNLLFFSTSAEGEQPPLSLRMSLFRVP